ncbi:SAM-dependent methyltransferase [Reichenbachiella sp. MALMAid0571]|uniref:THUMP-like domain-containing protein n=1 Tax=Reichenbachiella sp. MALMAid0571 TaxID=3143939 RepID=UPI0032DEF297
MIEELSKPEVIEFVLQHENEEPTKLILGQSKYKNIPVQLAVAQIQSRKKARKKLPEWYSVQGVLFPHGVSLEQCSSELTAKYKSNLIKGNTLIDLTGGTGIDTFYLSKSFQNTIYVEQNEALSKLARHNFSALSTSIRVENCLSEEFLKKESEPIDWFYIDPARRDEYNKKVFRIDDCTPNILDIQEKILSKSKGLLVKFAPLLDITEITRNLSNISAIHVVSVNNECKELLIKMMKGYSGDIAMHAVNLQSNDLLQEFSYLLKNESLSDVSFSLPKKYLYEPNSAVLKSGAFKLVANQYQLEKLHINSHLYTSEKQVADFPGRTFEIIGIETLKKQYVLPYLPDGKANITTRNFPMSVNQIRKKTGIKEGGEIYIFATTLVTGKASLIICKKIRT